MHSTNVMKVVGLMAAVALAGCSEMPGMDGGTGGGSSTGGGAATGGGGATGGGSATGGGGATGGGAATGGGGGATGGGGGTMDAGTDAGVDAGIITGVDWTAALTTSPLPAVPPDLSNAYADSADAAVLGQRFYFESSYSGALVVGADGGNGSLGDAGVRGLVSCFSCHSGPVMLTDVRSVPNNVSLGTNYGPRNALGVANSSFYTWTNWGGRFDTQWSLPLAVAENANIMASTRLEVVHMIWNKYRAQYDATFPVPLDPALDPTAVDAARFPPVGKPKANAADPDGPWEMMTATDRAIVNRIYANFGKAIAAYVRKNVSRDAPWDQFIAGDVGAISASAQRGFLVFKNKGRCMGCHSGPLFSDKGFHNLGVSQTGAHVPATDNGRFADVTPLLSSAFNSSGAYSDDADGGRLTGLAASDSMRGQFRTPTLRGLTTSGPYMHAGQFATLQAVVDFYDQGGGTSVDGGTLDAQLMPLGLTAQEKTDLIEFLHSLDGAPVDAALLVNTAAP